MSAHPALLLVGLLPFAAPPVAPSAARGDAPAPAAAVPEAQPDRARCRTVPSAGARRSPAECIIAAERPRRGDDTEARMLRKGTSSE